jgi:hypothetical protein
VGIDRCIHHGKYQDGCVTVGAPHTAEARIATATMAQPHNGTQAPFNKPILTAFQHQNPCISYQKDHLRTPKKPYFSRYTHPIQSPDPPSTHVIVRSKHGIRHCHRHMAQPQHELSIHSSHNSLSKRPSANPQKAIFLTKRPSANPEKPYFSHHAPY